MAVQLGAVLLLLGEDWAKGNKLEVALHRIDDYCGSAFRCDEAATLFILPDTAKIILVLLRVKRACPAASGWE
jgi:hypothetical protein